ncbi:class I SAM-dependent methyltransferase [Streptomyces sp. NPDC050485]|uniref:class I SAM-dependent methyltransferase n=1 Tax=Streptomyces sp. NPDC050485 TaxID=3365617 RepID=UPI0037B3456B
MNTAQNEQLRDGYDAFHRARARSTCVARLYAEAMGDAYPVEVAPHSSCDWPLLGTLASQLRLNPGELLVDAGCGTGGVGLWLARSLSASLLGIDISPVAVDLADARRAAFVAPERATFRVATLAATGLPDAHAHGLVCIDALGNAPDRTAALGELHRILRPGGRAIITRAVRRTPHPLVLDQEEAAGFAVEHIGERPGEPAMWARLYRLWIAHEADLRRELGNDQAQNMLNEANRMLPRLAGRRSLVLTLRRQPDPTAPQ